MILRLGSRYLKQHTLYKTWVIYPSSVTEPALPEGVGTARKFSGTPLSHTHTNKKMKMKAQGENEIL